MYTITAEAQALDGNGNVDAAFKVLININDKNWFCFVQVWLI